MPYSFFNTSDEGYFVRSPKVNIHLPIFYGFSNT
jgi:hypothetical protein